MHFLLICEIKLRSHFVAFSKVLIILTLTSYSILIQKKQVNKQRKQQRERRRKIHLSSMVSLLFYSSKREVG